MIPAYLCLSVILSFVSPPGEVDEPGKAAAAGDLLCDGAGYGRPVPQ